MRTALFVLGVSLLAACGGAADEAAPTEPGGVAGEQAATIQLVGDGTGVNGVAHVQAGPDGTLHLTLDIEDERAEERDGRLVAQMREGACDDPGGLLHPIGPVVGGTATANVQLDPGVDTWSIVVLDADLAEEETLAVGDVLSCGEATGALDENDFP